MVNSLVSVIIPAYNAADLIEEALASVERQTYPHWEVIIVEDGTDDGTAAIADAFSQQVGNKRVRYIHHTVNQGLSATRNTAMQSAQGDYIALLDHDDLWKPEHLESMVATLETSGYDLAYPQAELFDYTSHRVLSINGPSEWDLAHFPASLFNRNFIPVSGVVMKKTVGETIGGFDPTLRRVEDLDYWIRAAEAGLTFGYFPQVTTCYRQRNPKAMTAQKANILEWHALVLRKHRKAKIVPETIRDRILARYHLGVARRSFKQDPHKALEFLIWSCRISPLGSLAALYWFWQEARGVASREAW